MLPGAVNLTLGPAPNRPVRQLDSLPAFSVYPMTGREARDKPVFGWKRGMRQSWSLVQIRSMQRGTGRNKGREGRLGLRRETRRIGMSLER
jgi:hypothetical protein